MPVLESSHVALVRLPCDYGGTDERVSPHPRDLMWPAQLMYAAALLRREGFAPLLLDEHPRRLEARDLARVIRDHRPATLVMDVATPDVPYCLELARECRAQMPELAIWAAGQHPSYDAGVFLGPGSAIDGCIQGELLDSVRELARQARPDRIPGAVVRDGDALVRSAAAAEAIAPDELPPIDAADIDLDAYRLNSVHVPRFRPVRWAFLQTSWGCPFDCLFCSQTLRASYGSTWRGQSPERVVDDMARLRRDHGLRAFYLMDDVTTFDRNRTLELASLIRRRRLDVHWVIQTRSDFLDVDMLPSLRSAGCVGIKFGVESGDPAILEMVSKNLSLDRTIEVGQAVRRAGLALTAYYMLGFPGETLAQMERTFEVARQIGSEMIQVAIYTPYPTSRGFDEFPADRKADLLAHPERFSHYNTTVPINLSAVDDDQLLAFQRDFYLRYYLSPRQIGRYLSRRAIYTVPQGTDLPLIRSTLGYLLKRMPSGQQPPPAPTCT
jgi:anaerobic magnesium-protoporphyrin IX monomethyl ester cyclase